jgi:hypothetical protein
MLYVDTKTWLPDDLLIKADKITMANSVELRVPLLDEVGDPLRDREGEPIMVVVHPRRDALAPRGRRPPLVREGKRPAVLGRTTGLRRGPCGARMTSTRIRVNHQGPIRP